MSRQTIRLSHLVAFAALAGFATGDLSAQRGGRGGGARSAGQARASTGSHHKSKRTHQSAAGTHHRSTTHGSAASRTSTHRNVSSSSVNRGNGNRVNNGNINTGDVNVNVNGHGHGYGYHPVARGVVAGATAAAVMGHYYNTLPAGCATVHHGGLVYHHCGSAWYRNEGTQYVVVQQP